MQNIYEKDTLIMTAYIKELGLFNNATALYEIEQTKNTKIALSTFYNKHKLISERDKIDLRKIDDIWLTMEGLGQYAMYEYFINTKGGNLSESEAINAVKTKRWSQEEGFAIFKLLTKYKKPEIWAKYFFSEDMKTVIEVLEKEVK